MMFLTTHARANALWPRIRANTLVILTALFIVSVQNIALWKLVLDSVPSLWAAWPMLLGLAIAIWALMSALIALIASPGGLKPILVGLLLIGAICSYFMQAFGVVIDRNMLVNALQTDASEAADLIGIPLLRHVLLLGVLPSWIVSRVRLVDNSRFGSAIRLLILCVVSIGLAAAVVIPQYKTVSFWARTNKSLQLYVNPTYPLYALYKFAKGEVGNLRAPRELKVIAPDATMPTEISKRPLVVVLVVGETARAAQFSLNGYARLTNPRLSEVQNLLNYPEVSACGTATAISLPCMFSHLGRRQYSDREAAGQENLLDVLQRVGVSVHWDDNNAGCKGNPPAE